MNSEMISEMNSEDFEMNSEMNSEVRKFGSKDFGTHNLSSDNSLTHLGWSVVALIH